MGYCYPSEGILAAKTKKAEFHWRLKLPECVIEDLEEGMTEEEFIQRYMTFTIPSDMILTKMYNLREFRSKGIILDPIRKCTNKLYICNINAVWKDKTKSI